MSHKNHTKALLQDLLLIGVSIFIAITLTQTNVLIDILTSTKELELLGSFIAGVFFTSIFTTAPAIATLAEISHVNSIVFTALFGALGALIGDLIIFRFVRDKFSQHILELIKFEKPSQKVKALFKLKIFRWMTFLVGGLIIASPLPDELGISLLGFSKIKMSWFITFSFVFNFIGIVLIGLIARAV